MNSSRVTEDALIKRIGERTLCPRGTVSQRVDHTILNRDLLSKRKSTVITLVAYQCRSFSCTYALLPAKGAPDEQDFHMHFQWRWTRFVAENSSIVSITLEINARVFKNGYEIWHYTIVHPCWEIILYCSWKRRINKRRSPSMMHMISIASANI